MIDNNNFATSVEDFFTGELILIDKDAGWTSFDVVNKIRHLISYAAGRKKFKVGHSGTLDPLATGLLLIATGKKTKELSGFLKLNKTYIAEVRFGEETPSYDKETDVNKTCNYSHITKEKIEEVILREFTGEIDQVPPLFSASKINGKRAYEYARKGKEKELKTKRIKIHEFRILAYNLPNVTFLIKGSSGTYIRSLARDLGKSLGSCAYLTSLRRSEVGDYKVENALKINEFEEKLKQLEKLKNI